MILYIRKLKNTELQVIVYQRNVYIVHSESVLLTMVCNADIDIPLVQQRIVDDPSQNNSIIHN